MGRKKSHCTQYFEISKDEQSKCEKARCRFCGSVSAKNTVRMKTHLVKACTECPENVKAEFLSEIAEEESESSTDEESHNSPGHDTSHASEKRRRKSGQKSQRRKKKRRTTERSMLQEEHAELDRALADFLFSANLPISTLENPYFVAFCKKLRPSYTLPTRHRVVSQTFIQSATPVPHTQMAYYSSLGGSGGGAETAASSSMSVPFGGTPSSVSVPFGGSPPGTSVPFSGTPPGMSVPLVVNSPPSGAGTLHQVPAGISSPELLQQQQPGTFHLVRITNT